MKFLFFYFHVLFLHDSKTSVKVICLLFFVYTIVYLNTYLIINISNLSENIFVCIIYKMYVLFTNYLFFIIFFLPRSKFCKILIKYFMFISRERYDIKWWREVEYAWHFYKAMIFPTFWTIFKNAIKYV